MNVSEEALDICATVSRRSIVRESEHGASLETGMCFRYPQFTAAVVGMSLSSLHFSYEIS